MVMNINKQLEAIHKGMDVYDPENNKIGTVEFVQYGDEDLATPEPETGIARDPNARNGTLVEDIAEAIAPPNELPEEIASRMLREGYIKIDTGLLRSDRYALLSQVSSVSDDRVMLTVGRDSLISR